MVKEFTVFGSQTGPNMDYLIGMPSGQIIDLDKKEHKYINYLKQEGVITFNDKLNSFCFSDSSYYKILNLLNRLDEPDESDDKITYFFDHQKSVRTFLINSDGTVDVSGDVIITDGEFKNLPMSFRNVTGDFIFKNCDLNDLTGSPRKVGGDFNVSGNNLFDLKNGPMHVGRHYNCSNNFIQSLEGSPDRVFGNFDCSENFLPNLIGGPRKVTGHFDCSDNPLEYMDGRPECNNIIGGIKRKKTILRNEGDGKYSW